MSKPSWKISHNLYLADGKMISWSEEAFEVLETDLLQWVLNKSVDNFMQEKGHFKHHHIGYFLLTSNGMIMLTVEMLKEKFNEFIGKYKDEEVLCFLNESFGSCERCS